MQSFVTHPEVVRALGALVLDAGAAEVYIVEAVYQWGSYTEWGYEDAAKDIGATLIDLNSPDPYDEFVDVSSCRVAATLRYLQPASAPDESQTRSCPCRK